MHASPLLDLQKRDSDTSILLAFFCGGLSTVLCLVFLSAALRGSLDENYLIEWGLSGALATFPVLGIAASYMPRTGASEWLMIPIAIVGAPLFVALVVGAFVALIGGLCGIAYGLSWLKRAAASLGRSVAGKDSD